MDRCSRWFYSGDALARENTVAPSLPIVDTARPHTPRIWERCPVCGHFVASHPEWTAQIVYDDGIALFFDGAWDLFWFLLSPRRLIPNPELVPVAGMFVTSYYDRTAVEARGAFFVVGGDVLGPGGEELVAHRSVDEAREFLWDHCGTRIVGFEQIDTLLLLGLDRCLGEGQG